MGSKMNKKQKMLEKFKRVVGRVLAYNPTPKGGKMKQRMRHGG